VALTKGGNGTLYQHAALRADPLVVSPVFVEKRSYINHTKVSVLSHFLESVWGLIGSVLSIGASLLFMIRFIGLDATYMMLNMPIALQQLALALWLIVKGFNYLPNNQKSDHYN
jgi:uncharacterized membrane protein required for colicin V production